jgi:hypothetical protein
LTNPRNACRGSTGRWLRWRQQYRGQQQTGRKKRLEVEMLEVKRTDVEKLFTVHSAYEQNRAANKARHYYDLLRLSFYLPLTSQIT